MEPISQFWAYSTSSLLKMLDSNIDGLTVESATSRANGLHHAKHILPQWKRDALLLLRQYSNPLVLILVLAVVLSLVLGEYSNSSIILVVLVVTGIMGFWQERNAGRAVEKLQSLIKSRSNVKRNGGVMKVDLEEVVPGDIVLLSAGDLIPADALLLEANDLHVNEAMLTGESFPAEKMTGDCAADTPLPRRFNCVWKGTSVINGTATILAVNVGQDTELGSIATTLSKTNAGNVFEKDIIHFGYLLMRLTFLIAMLVLVLNILFHKPVIDSVIFALALAVGLAPELLPAIVTITLSTGARRMAERKVIVKKLSAIQSLGEMDILCCDKTGTLTQGVMKIEAVMDVSGNANPKVNIYAYLNAFFETGFSNPIDEAIRNELAIPVSVYSKMDEVPYDFFRKRLSIVAGIDQRHIMITKGAVPNILACCVSAELANGQIVPLQQQQATIEKLVASACEKGNRVIALCYKDVTDHPVIRKEDENNMTFLGLLLFADPLKEGIVNSIEQLRAIGINIKLITGDNQLVARQVGNRIGMRVNNLLTGEDLIRLTSEALQIKVNEVEVFAEIEPAQKERIIHALQSNGHAVGFLGDGINDAAALKAADAGISTENAVDVAKEAAPLVLLEKNLDVIHAGVLEGRTTFANTLKYIHVSTSANFGNMLSMAIASLILPFLPLLPIQILLNNFLSDLPALAIASDHTDEAFLQKPRRWDMRYIKRFMVVFGLLSSIFDFLTFGIMLYLFHTPPGIFRTGWFIESLLTQILILQIIRTKLPFFKSRPSTYLAMASLFTFLAALILPFLPFSRTFGLEPVSLALLATILGIALLYALVSEFTKQWVMKRL